MHARGPSMAQLEQFFAQFHVALLRGIEFLQLVAGALSGGRDKRQNDGGSATSGSSPIKRDIKCGSTLDPLAWRP